MTSSISGIGAPNLIGSAIRQQTTSQNIGVAVLQKGQQIQKIEGGRPILNLIDAAIAPLSPGSIDIHA